MTESDKERNSGGIEELDSLNDRVGSLNIGGKIDSSYAPEKDSAIISNLKRDNPVNDTSVVTATSSKTKIEKDASLKTLNKSNSTEKASASAGSRSSEEKTCESNESDDDKTMRLLSLLNKYEILANDSFRLNFISGFLDLSRANYYGPSRFSVDSIDRRPRDATAKIEAIDKGKFILRDFWEEFKIISKTQKAAQAESKKSTAVQSKKETPETDDAKSKDKPDSNTEGSPKKEKTEIRSDNNEAVTSARESASEIRNRKQKAPNPNHQQSISAVDGDGDGDEDGDGESREAKNSELHENSPVDPIHQFGRMVPYQLRNAQSHFQGALRDSIELLTLQQEILHLVKSLQKQAGMN